MVCDNEQQEEIILHQMSSKDWVILVQLGRLTTLQTFKK